MKFTLSFLSCRAYGKQGITAVTRDADAILQALIIIRSSMIMSFTSPQPLWTMNTSSPRTDSPISTLHQSLPVIRLHHKNKTDINSLCSKSHCFKTPNIKILCTNSMHRRLRRELSHLSFSSLSWITRKLCNCKKNITTWWHYKGKQTARSHTSI